MEFTEEEALRKVSAFCACAEHCRSEVAEKLQRWGTPYEVIDRILDKLVAEKFIDEERYARAFVNDKYRFEKWGRQKILQALQLKKIPATVRLDALSVIDEQEYFAILEKLLASKRKSVRGADEFEINGKLMRFALSRGFDMKDIRRCIDVEEEISDENVEIA